MDFNDKQKEKLKKLADLYDREDVTDSQYRSMYRDNFADIDNETNYGDQPGARDPGAEGGEEKSDTRSYAEARQPTTEIEGRRQRSGSNKPMITSETHRRRHSFLPKRVLAGDSNTPSGGKLPAQRDSHSPSSGSNPLIRSSNTRIPVIQTQRRSGVGMILFFVAPAVFGLGLVVAIAYTRATSAPVFVAAVKNTPPPVAVRQLEDNTFVAMMFGPIAAEECGKECGIVGIEIDRKICSRACRRLQPSVFGRRITRGRLEPAEDAKEAALKCLNKETPAETYTTQAEWSVRIRDAVTALKRSTPFEEASRSMIEASRKLHMPLDGARDKITFTQNTLRAICLRAHHTAAQHALELAKKSGDEFSVDYFSVYQEAIGGSANAFESKLSFDLSPFEVTNG